MSGFTPGPWKFWEGDGRENPPGVYNIVLGEFDCAVCYTADEAIGSIGNADAHLIAAAPDGLAFAQAFLDWHEGPGRTDSPLADQARAFVAKATGAA